MAKCMIGMSGGVDSSVAALRLLEQGYDCIGVTMRLYDGPEEGSCCSLQDVEDAKAVCRTLGIPHYTFNFTREFDRDVHLLGEFEHIRYQFWFFFIISLHIFSHEKPLQDLQRPNLPKCLYIPISSGNS